MTAKQSILKQLAMDLGINPSQFKRLVIRAPHTYKIYSIPKKSGGLRTIAQPARETKSLQYWIIKNVFKDLPISKQASAYIIGKSIKENAKSHAKNSYILKMDFNNFFNSITKQQIKNHLIATLPINEDEAEILSKLSCIKYKNSDTECLSVGAPSSPTISNSIMYDFDIKMNKWCTDNSVVYTRYADDLAFSTNIKNITHLIEESAKEILQSCKNLSLSFNENKTTHLSKKHRRSITGLKISNDEKVTLGRDKKREISKNIFLYKKNILSESQIDSLQGTLGFAKHIDPLFIHSMAKKHGYKAIEEIFTHRKNNDEKN